MLKIKVKDEIFEHAKNQVEKFNFGQRGIADGNQEEQRVGLIGQTAVQELLGLEWPSGKTGFDNGVDFIMNGKRVDVKTMGRTVDMRDYFVHNFLGLQKKYDVDIYIFCSFNKLKGELTICGSLKKEEFDEKSNFYPEGTIRTRSNGTTFRTKADLYEIPQTNLDPINSVEDIRNL
mgnify:CR=1 FL=1